MYNQSISLLEKINDFRNKQFDFLAENNISCPGNKKIIIHVIPSTFLDYETHVNAFMLNRNDEYIYARQFKSLYFDYSVPNTDGLCYLDDRYNNFERLQIYNNNILELTIKLDTIMHSTTDREALKCNVIFQKIRELTEDAIEYYRYLNLYCKVYISVSITGCIGAQTEYDIGTDYTGIIDRNKIFCNPIEIYDINNTFNIQEAIYNQKVIVCNSLGIKRLETYCGSKPVE